ncbi:hypothetical protein L226DRAFT_315347 [Lentinus tigrinus ALCF2SS1-7]|uniref:Uncharacterized protein n=1 Tax=Lentinus tigrinus ALCF2SS1-6 TaxID=1328759 RepID=A0A5C2S689_9APHY|nr:hypothetical protein L227DRAFT_611959 [Lentinus tigrinus ALCF2SS1-6]RPD68758.1 hypothetical protein L226DRAFT_315347 [Lentinus tigrinus ALCF2SS1-7]
MQKDDTSVVPRRSAQAVTPLKTNPKRKREGRLVAVERDKRADYDEFMIELKAHLEAVASMTLEKRIWEIYQHTSNADLLRLKWPLHLAFHMIPIPLTTPVKTIKGQRSARKAPRDERRYKEAYRMLLLEMFPASLGFYVREEVLATEEHHQSDAVDTGILFVIVWKDMPLLMVEFKDPDVLNPKSGRVKADAQMRRRLRVAVQEMVPGITSVYGLSAIGLNVRFYYAYKRADDKLIIIPAPVKEPADPTCLPSKDYLADQWLMKITDSKAVAMLRQIRRDIIAMVRAALEQAPAVLEEMLKLKLCDVDVDAAVAEREKTRLLLKALDTDVAVPFEGNAYVETYGIPEGEVTDNEDDNQGEYSHE